MTVKNNQLDVPYSPTEQTKLASIEVGAQVNPASASQAEALAGLDNVKMMTPLRVAEAIEAGGGSGGTATGLTATYLNSSGGSLAALTVVSQDSSGNIVQTDPTSEISVEAVLGILTVTTINGASGAVLLDGLLQNIITGLSVNSLVYLSRTGAWTINVPDIGSNGFQAGDFVVKIGKVTKNSTSPSAKDFKLEIEVIGQL